MEIIGQFFGILAVLTSIYSYQMNHKRKLLALQILAAAFFSIHYAFLGAFAGMVMNAVCVMRNIAYYFRDKPILKSKLVPYGFALMMIVLGALTYQGWYTLLLIVGLAVNTVCVALPSPQKVRVSILFTCPLCLVYNAMIFSIGGVLNEILAMVSAVIGIVRFRKKSEEN